MPKDIERGRMKFLRFLVLALFFAPFASFAAPGEFAVAAQLLAAAKNADIQQVQILVNNGANINYVDNTGLSLVCTALMNNDLRAAQILQMYGADASQCDRQIKDYKTRNTPERTGGLFGGLSTAQGIVLAAAGAAVVIGGLFLLTDIFDPDNDNNNSSGGSGVRPDSGGSTTPGESGSAIFTGGIPYGPAFVGMTDATAISTKYNDNLAFYATGDMENTFELMNGSTDPTASNYGAINYLLLMRGYSPLARGYLGQRTLRNADNSPIALADNYSGGRPVNVALVTANGINAAENTSLYDENNVTWLETTGSILGVSNKYYNNILTSTESGYTVAEDVTGSFDLSGSESPTAIHNTDASATDNMLAKIVGGYTSAGSGTDFIGFMPNGQMTIYRTGGGASGDYYNYTALSNALSIRTNSTGGRSRVDVIANLDVIEPLHLRTAPTIDYVLTAGDGNYETSFYNFVGQTYGTASTEANMLPVTNAQTFFVNLNTMGANNSFSTPSAPPLVVFSTGASVQELTGQEYLDPAQEASFENAAPIIYSNLEHLFMSVVGVGVASTESATAISANTNGIPVSDQKYQLAQWPVGSGTDVTYYKSRICGAAGTGNNGAMDPWCFAAVGLTDEMAAAAAAGAAGVLTSAFYYMSPAQIFTLLALTADGPFLYRRTAGAVFTESELISYLRSMYTLPNEYNPTDAQYLDVFKQVFGYGVINLERATTPGTNLYFYNGNTIASTPNSAYWRAAMNTGLRGSSALNLGRGAIDIAAYDILESIDGSMRLPRIWKNSFAFDDGGRRGLYMGDVLGDLRVRRVAPDMTRIGNLSFGLTRSERAYNDNMNGLDSMRFEYANGNWNLAADYQHYLTDGESRFTGVANPILALASNALTTGAHYKYGNWSFGARGFSGVITDEGLLENDPTISSNYEPMHLGAISGAQSEAGWGNNRFGLNTAVGAMRENNTVLGAYGSGLMAIGASNTNYIDIDAYIAPWESVKLRARATFAHTVPNIETGGLVQMSEFDSNAFAAALDIGNFSFGASLPLAVTRGGVDYAYANYDIVEGSDGRYDLAISDMETRRIDMVSHSRELRFNASYRHKLGEFTDGAIGFIYRINPNNIDEYGNESIFMMKLSHAIGI